MSYFTVEAPIYLGNIVNFDIALQGNPLTVYELKNIILWFK